jgi:hypothetical protein
MAMSRKKAGGTNLPSTNIDPLRAELNEIFADYPPGAAIAYGFLKTESTSPFIQIADGLNIWRVRRDAVDRYVDGVTDRVELRWKSSHSSNTEPSRRCGKRS